MSKMEIFGPYGSFLQALRRGLWDLDVVVGTIPSDDGVTPW